MIPFKLPDPPRSSSLNRFGISISEIIFYPFLFALYPVTSLLANNIQEIVPSQSYRSFLMILLVTVLMLPLLRLIFNDWHRAAFLYAIIILFFFSYGHLYSVLKTLNLGSVVIGRHRYLIPIFTAVLLLAIFLLIWKKPRLERFSGIANLIALGLLLIPITGILIYVFRSRTGRDDFNASPTRIMQSMTVPPEDELPDIYYVILDGYARQDVMLEVFDYDNSEFLESLTSRGFYIADESNTNHNYTALSLASSLNMEYAHNLGLHLVQGNYPEPFVKPIRNSLVAQILKELGYQTIGFKSGYLPTEWIDADFFFTPIEEDLKVLRDRFTLNAFEAMLLNSTAVRILFDLVNPGFWDWIQFNPEFQYDVMRNVVLFSFDNAAKIPEISAPTFTFLHVIIPHPPYMFGPNGEFINEDRPYTLKYSPDLSYDQKSKLLYRDQAIFATKEVEELVDRILATSSTEPIIILQADHGPSPSWGEESISHLQRTAILNAYHLPDACDRFLYPSVTPVNTFRIIFNCVFSGEFPLLEDRIYFSKFPSEHPYSFTDITDEVR